MDLRLAYRIASMKIRYPGMEAFEMLPDSEALIKRTASQVELIKKSPKIIIDNVADFYAMHEQQEWSIEEDVPNMAPPFGNFFVEFNYPKKWNIHGETVLQADLQIGLHCLAMSVKEPINLSHWRMFLSGLVGAPFDDLESNGIAEAISRSKWVIFCDHWAADSRAPLFGSPLWLGTHYLFFVASSGKCFKEVFTGITSKYEQERAGGMVWDIGRIFGLGLSFMHCKNIELKESVDDKGERWHRRTKTPKYTFHTLNIEPMRKVLRTEGGSDEVGIKKALHICRGHFAHYSDDKPLFGKYAGMFFRPDHVRGSKEHGVVGKEYSVKTGN